MALLGAGMRDIYRSRDNFPVTAPLRKMCLLCLFVSSTRSLASGQLWSESPDQSPVRSQCLYNPEIMECEDHGGWLSVVLSQHKETCFLQSLLRTQR